VLTVAEGYAGALAQRAPELAGVWSAPAALSMADDGWAARAAALLSELDRELDESSPGGVIAAEALLLSLLVIALRQFVRAGELGRAAIPGGPADLVQRFRALVEAHYRDARPLSFFADALGVSLAQLRAACLGATGQSPLKLIHERILVEAKRNLVYSARPISQIAYDVGFEDPAYFSRFFARHAGEPPATFRAKRALAQAAA